MEDVEDGEKILKLRFVVEGLVSFHSTTKNVDLQLNSDSINLKTSKKMKMYLEMKAMKHY